MSILISLLTLFILDNISISISKLQFRPLLILISQFQRVCMYSGSIKLLLIIMATGPYKFMPQAGFKPPLRQREVCCQSTALPPSHHGWIYLSKYANSLTNIGLLAYDILKTLSHQLSS